MFYVSSHSSHVAFKYPRFEADKPYGTCDITIAAVGFLHFTCFF